MLSHIALKLYAQCFASCYETKDYDNYNDNFP